MSSLLRHAGLSVRQMNPLRSLEGVLVRKKDRSKAQTNPVKAQMTLVIAQTNAFIRKINAFNALKTLVIRLLNRNRSGVGLSARVERAT
jgi:hypothetical protein